MVYPNPVRGLEETVKVRFYSGASHTARLTVYDLQGEQVLARSLDARADETEEIDWPTRSLAPGAYLCRLDFVGRGGASTEIMTLYVER